MKVKNNIKKYIVIMLSLVMVVTMFAACGQKEEEDENDQVIAGMLPTLGATAEEMTQSVNSYDDPSEVVVQYFDDLNSLVLALQGGKIDHIGRMPEATAKYIADKYPDIKVDYTVVGDVEPQLSFSMGFNGDKKDIADKVQAALDEMKGDGTIDKLIADYVDAFVEGEEPTAVDMPVIDGAETIKMVVTGDLPPFDYVSVDGKPSGFNTAVLAEISKRINMNIELIYTNSAGRAAALASGKADGLFYISEWSYGDRKSNTDCPEGIITAGPFYESKCYALIKAE